MAQATFIHKGEQVDYTPGADVRAMFELPRWVIKAGRVIVENGEIREDVEGKVLHVEPNYDPAAVPDIQEWFEAYYTIQFANYPVEPEYLSQREVVPCGSGP